MNRYSRRITQPKSQGASQAMLYGTGLTQEDMAKAQVGIASVWYEGNTCNMHLLELAAEVKRGVGSAGMVGMRFNTIGVSDGISMGTDGMSFSLQSRDLIGRGGMGDVYRVRDEVTGRELALKRLRRERGGRGRSLALFEREFHTLAQLAHPCII